MAEFWQSYGNWVLWLVMIGFMVWHHGGFGRRHPHSGDPDGDHGTHQHGGRDDSDHRHSGGCH